MESAVPAWKWALAIVFLLGSAFCSGTETALTALGDARARQLRDEGGSPGARLRLWIEHPERVLSTLLIGNTLVNIGAGALAASLGVDVAAWTGWSAATVVAATTAAATAVILFFGEIVPKTLGKRHPVRFALAALPLSNALTIVLWPASAAVTRITGALLSLLGGKHAAGAPAVTGEEIEYLIEMGTREGVLDEVKEELLNSVLEFADRVAKEIMTPRTRMVAIDREAAPEDLVRVVTENPYSRMPVYEGSVDNVIGILLVRDIVQDVRGPQRSISLERHLKPAFFVPEGMKISRLLKEMQRRRTHLAVVVDEFGGTSGLVTLEDVLEEIVGEIQDEADVEAAPVKAVSPGVWLADAAVPLRELEAFLDEGLARATASATGRAPGIRFPEEGDYETLGGFVTATAGRVPPVGAAVTWGGLTFTVRAGDERRVTRVEIARPPDEAAAAATPAVAPVAARG
ncbi:hemolysin family protein [Anaeromyxobacter oryzisoli]|uniref:hemolysin family protein n=1 Tax=Anaeromyxobacter oryzisoli TaxID=2925408 RepID=UPI001F56814D|nr:hemolysin family protein [Anaeromyxobacter sp. SG63]